MIELTQFQRSDFKRLIGWVPNSDALMQWAGMVFSFPLTKSQLEKRLEFAEMHPERRKIWNTVHRDAVIGHIELNNIWDHDQKATLNRVIVDPQQRGNGFGKEMVQRVLQYSFEDLNLHRIELDVWDFNSHAIRCYEACGFVREGLQRECRRMGEGWWSALKMSILEQEWRNQVID